MYGSNLRAQEKQENLSKISGDYTILLRKRLILARELGHPLASLARHLGSFHHMVYSMVEPIHKTSSWGGKPNSICICFTSFASKTAPQISVRRRLIVWSGATFVFAQAQNAFSETSENSWS